MAAASQSSRTFSPTVRFLAALSAVMLLFNTWQWSHSTPVQVAYGCMGALAFGSFAFFGTNHGWRRYLMLVLLAAFVALGAWRLVVSFSV